MPKNISKDVAVENVSADSLSFASFICIEEQYCKSQKVHASVPTPTKNNAARSGSEDLDFEFGSVIAVSTNDALDGNSFADVLFSDGKLAPQAVLMQTSQSHSDSKNSSRPPRSNNTREGGNKVISGTGSAKRSDTEVRNKANKQKTAASQGFGHKLIKSIATPCRSCSATQPTPSMKQQSLRQ